MATLLSGIELIQGLGFYSVVFPFIFILAIVYGILAKTKPFGDNWQVNIILSTVIGFLFISMTDAVDFMNALIPMLMVFFVIIIMVLLFFMFMGVEGDSMQAAFAHPAVYGIVIGIIVLIIFITMSSTVSELSVKEQTDIDSNGNVAQSRTDLASARESTAALAESENRALATVFHPTTVGIIVMCAIFAVATYMITGVTGESR